MEPRSELFCEDWVTSGYGRAPNTNEWIELGKSAALQIEPIPTIQPELSVHAVATKLNWFELALDGLRAGQRNRLTGDPLEPCWCPECWRDLPEAHHPRCQAVRNALGYRGFRNELIVGGHRIPLSGEGS